MRRLVSTATKSPAKLKRLSRGVLTAKTDSLSTVSIRWQDVTRVRGEIVFEIILTCGSPRYGVLSPDPAGNLLMTGTPAIPLLTVVALTPIASRFANRFDGSVDFGYNFQKSNTTGAGQSAGAGVLEEKAPISFRAHHGSRNGRRRGRFGRSSRNNR